MHNSIDLWLRRIGRRLVRPVVAVLIVATLVTTTGPSPAAAVEPFDAPVFSVNQSGDIVFAANTLLTCSGTTGICGDAKNNPGGTAQANNSFSMIDVDVDGDPSTFNSSSAVFDLPAGASVTWAGLFWGAVSTAAARDTVEFAAPGSGYQTVTAPAANIYTSGSTYQAFADVTSIVQAAGGGSYTTANVNRSTGGGRHAGWTLIVVTDDPNQPFRNLAVFDGFQRVNSGNPVDITVSGFLSPPVGPVNAEIGFVAYEGDDRYTGDYAQLNGTRLGDALSPTTNFFNSRITDGGAYATGGDPNYYDQLGFDAKIIETVGIVPPGATSAVVQLRSAGDWYYPGVVTTAIDIFVPNLVLDLDKIVVDDDGGDVNVGDTLTYTIAFSNQGEDAALDTVLRDAIPAGTTYVPNSATIADGDNIGTANAVYDGTADEVLFYLGTGASAGTGGRVAPFATTGTDYEVEFQVTVDPGTENTDIDNVATLEYEAETIGEFFASDTPLRRVTVEPAADLVLTAKNDTVDPVIAGNSTTYSIDIENLGPSPSENTQVVDTLPAGFTFASGAGCSAASQVVTCELGTVAVGATATATFDVNVDGTAPARVETNNAEVRSTTPDGEPSNNFGSETTTVERLVDLATTKTFVDDPTLAGEQITYTVTVTNNGPSDARNVDLVDALPAGVSFVSATLAPASSGSCADDAGTITCEWATLASGATETATIVVGVPSSTADGVDLTNKATATSDDPEDPTGASNDASTVTPIERSADLSIAKTAAGPFIAGTTVVFTVSVTNDGPSDATNISIEDTLPLGTSFVAGTSSTACNDAGPTIECDLDTLDAGATADFFIAVDLPADIADATDLTNSVTVGADENDPQLADNVDELDFTVARSTDLEIVKKATPDVVVAGSQITYTLDVTNTGPSDASGVTVTDVLPSGVTLVSAPGCTGTTTLACSVGTLANGASTSFTVVVGVPSGTADGLSLVNSASVTGAETDPAPTNNASSTSTNVTRTTALEITKVESASIADPALAGTPISWDIVVTNTGLSDDADVAIADDLSALPISGVTATITNDPTNSCTITPGASDPGSLDCSVPNLLSGETVTVTVAGTLDADIAAGTTISNQASAESPTSPTVTGDEETTIQRVADISLAKTAPPTITAGTTGTWVITVTNDGPGVADDIVVTDILPVEATYVTHRITTGSATCSTAAGPLVCTNPTLGIAPGNVLRIEVDASIADTAADGSTVTNTAILETSTTDADPNDNVVSVDSTIVRSADLQLAKTTLDTPIAAGETTRFQLTVTNAGPSIATDVVVTDTLPAGFTFVPGASDANCSDLGGTITCTIASLDPDDGPASFLIAVESAPGLSEGTRTNSATVAATEDDPDEGDPDPNNDASSDVEIIRQTNVSIAKTPGAAVAVPGEPFTWTIDVTNDGPSTATGPVVTDTLPVGVAFDDTASDNRCDVTAGTPATGQTITCTLSDLAVAPTTPETITIVVDVQADLGAGATDPTLENGASVSTTTDDTNADDDTATSSTPIVGQADLSTAKTGSTDVVAGEAISWTITATNAGPSQAVGVELTDQLPPGVSFDALASDARCVVTGGTTETGLAITCDLDDVDPGVDLDVVIAGTVEAAGRDGSTITNNATISSSTNDPDGSNDASSFDTAISRSVSLRASKSATPTNVAAGGTVVYELSLTNDGPSNASLATLTDSLPSSLTIDTVALSTPGFCVDSITCYVNELAPGDSLTVAITATVDSSTPDPTTIPNTVTASAPEDPTGASASASITVTRSADLSVRKTASTTAVFAGAQIRFDIDVDNLGPSDATGVQLIDPIPAGLTYLDDVSDARCDQVGSDVVCTIGSLIDGGTGADIDLVFLVDTDTGAGPIENAATATATENDPVSDNDTGRDEIVVSTQADLAIAKSSSDDPVVPGEPYEWTLEVTNAGPSDAQTPVVTDTLPVGVTFDDPASDSRCDVTAGTPATGQTITCQLLDMAPTTGPATTPISLTIRGDVDPDIAPATITNTASITSTTDDPDAGDPDSNNTSSDVSPVTPTADLGVIKVGPATITAGTDLTWTVTASNAGPSTAAAPTVVDTLPVGVTFDDAASDSRCDVTAGTPATGQTVTCVLLDMAPTPDAGSTTDLVIAGSLADDAADASELVNAASIDSTTQDPNGSNDDGESRTDVNRIADLTITKVADESTVVAGEIATYTIVATNDGPSIATDVSVLDVLAAGLTFVSATPSVGTCDATATSVNCSVAQLDPGQSIEITVEALVGADVVAATDIDNTATATAAETDPDGAEATETITVDTSADLSVTKSLLTTNPTAGESATFELVITNDGPSDATLVELIDTLPAGLTFQPTGSDDDCSASGPGATCTLGTIAAGTSQTITIVADIAPSVGDLDPTVPTELTNTADVDALQDDPNTDDNTATADLEVVRSADLSVDKAPLTTSPVPGTATSWDVTVTNLGPSNATTITVTDTLPFGAIYDDATSDGRCSVTAAANAAAVPPVGETITCALPSLVDGGSDVFTIVVDLEATLTGDIVNTATVAAVEDDPSAANDSDTVTSTLAPSADLSVVKTRLTDPIVAGQVVSYELVVTNDGPSTAVDVVVSDTFPAVLVFDDSASDGRCDLDGAALRCDLGDLAPAEVETISLTFALDDDAVDGSSLINVASVTSDTPDPDESSPTGNNTSTDTAPIARSADLSIDKTGPATLTAGETGSYSITVTNDGPSVATGVSITDAVPAGMTITGSTGPAGCSTTPSALACAIPRLEVGETVDITIDVAVASTVPAGITLTNNAAVSANESDPNPGDNGSSVDATAERSADLGVTKAILTNPVVAGEPVVFQVTVTNDGPSEATNVTVDDALTSGLIFRDDLSSSPCAAAPAVGPGQTVTCSISILPVGASATFLIGADSPSTLATGETLSNTATVAGAEPDPNALNDTSTATATVTRETDLSVIKRGPAGPSIAGTVLRWTLDISNEGASDATDVVVTDTLPPGATFRPATSDARCVSTGATSVECSVADLAAGATDQFIVDVDLASGLADGFLLTNGAAITGTEPDPNTGNNTSSHAADIVRTAGLSLTKVDLLDPVIAGETIGWDLEVTNLGPSDADDVLITDTLPIGITFDADASDTRCSLVSGSATTGQVIECDLDTIVVTNAESVQIIGAVDQGLTDGALLINAATATATGATSADAVEETTVNRSAEVTVTKVADASPITPGVPVNYTLTVTNQGPSQATEIELLDLVPPGGTVDDIRIVSGPGTASCSIAAGAVTCPIGTLDAAASAVIEIEMTPASFLTSGDTFENKAVVTGDEDPTPGEGSSTEPLARSVDLSITKTAATTVVAAGDGVTFDLTVTNGGPSDAANVVITDTLPPLMTLDPATTSPSCTPVSATEAQCAAAVLPAGESITFTIGVVIDPTATADLTNSVAVASDEPNRNLDPTADETIVLNEVADLGITKTGPDAVTAGTEISYSITVANAGPSVARNAIVTDDLPTTVEFTVPTGCAIAGSTLSCPVGDLAVGASATITLVGTVDPSADAPIRNVALAASDAADPNTADNTATTQAQVERSADLRLDKTLDTQDPRSGGTARWTIVVTNDGPSTATDVTVSDDLPDGLVAIATTPTCAGETSLVCEVGELAVGASATITLETSIAADLVGDIENRATASAAEDDPTDAEGSATAAISRSNAALSITKTGASTSLSSGSTVVWTVTVTNDGPDSIVTTIDVTDELPAALAYASHVAPDGVSCAADGQSFRCSIDGLEAGASAEIIITTTSRIDAAEVTNTATAAATGLNGGDGDDGTVVVASTAIARAPVSTIAFTGASTASLIFLAAPLLIMGFLAVQMSRRYEELESDPRLDG